MANWNSDRNSRVSSDDMLENENQRITDNLAGKVNRLKNIAFDIRTDTQDSSRYLDSMGSDFESGTGLLSGSMKRMNHMIGSGKDNRKLMCYLILGLVVIFIVLYYFVAHFRGR